MVMEMSKTYQYRKVMKPLLERKRRARINKCLDDLKDLMVECLQQEGEHVTRLEKADILELTVEHMRKLKQRGGLSLQHPTSAAHVESFRSGYVHAADQISQVLLQQRQTDEIGAKIMKFLSSRLLEMSPQLYRSTTSSTSALTIEPSAKHNYVTPALPTTAKLSLATPSSLYASTTTTTATTTMTTEPIIGTKLHGRRDIVHNCDFLIDVTTVDNFSSLSSSSSSADNVSVISVDSASSSDSVWRPW